MHHDLSARATGAVQVSAAGQLLIYSSLAQLVEHAAVNRRVVGSSPTGGAMLTGPCQSCVDAALFLCFTAATKSIFGKTLKRYLLHPPAYCYAGIGPFVSQNAAQNGPKAQTAG